MKCHFRVLASHPSPLWWKPQHQVFHLCVRVQHCTVDAMCLAARGSVERLHLAWASNVLLPLLGLWQALLCLLFWPLSYLRQTGSCRLCPMTGSFPSARCSQGSSMLKHPTSFSLFKTNILLLGGYWFLYLSVHQWALRLFSLGGRYYELFCNELRNMDICWERCLFSQINTLKWD